MPPRILALAGSLRKESFNKKLAAITVSGARKAGAEVAFINLEDLPLPLFDQDLESEQGMPENGARLKKLFIDHDGLLIACPEYNSSITAVLKNAIDWVSRPAPGEPSLVAFRGKVATLMSASPGALGGLRALVHVRSILGNIGVVVLPDQIAVPNAHEAFNADGSLKDPKQQADVEGLGQTLASFLTKLQA
jgi:chromate reductase